MAFLRNNYRPVPATRSILLAGIYMLATCLGQSQAINSCLDCHLGMEGNLGVTQEKFSQDIHAQKGLTCFSCYGGDASSYDPAQAMSRKAGKARSTASRSQRSAVHAIPIPI